MNKLVYFFGGGKAEGTGTNEGFIRRKGCRAG